MSDGALLLNVDDDDGARYVKTRILKLAGFQVIEAACGTEARQLVRERSPDLVLLDVRLPDMDGRDLCMEIKRDPATAQIVVLQTSATHVDMRHRVESLDAGADGYIVAPMEPAELVAQVHALLRMRRAERERQAALEELREADRRKDEFLAMLAHELRNPLAPIRNAVQILVSDDPAIREKARLMIGRQVQHIARLVDDLLEVSRITQRKVVLQPTVVQLATVIESAVEVARPFVDTKRQQLAVSLPPDELWLEVDAVRLSQVIGNLLHNASKFTPAGGSIGLDARVAGEMLEIVVRDDGEGITADVLPKVFDLFTQADRTLERTQGGLGIGLSLVKGLVTMHGGTVRAESGGRGEGSRFTIILPLSKLRALPPVSPIPSAAPGRNRPHRIRLVEDNIDAAESLKVLLQQLGHEVLVEGDGLQAVGAAQTFRPDVILLDIGLPGMDGYQIASALRSIPETRSARLIAVSGYGQAKDRKVSADAGFHVHLVKPVDPSLLLEAINDA